jgi:hypothetical protein
MKTKIGAGWPGKNDIMHWKANSTVMSPNQKSKQNIDLPTCVCILGNTPTQKYICNYSKNSKIWRNHFSIKDKKVRNSFTNSL